jgi:hypothetical protein
LAIVWGCKHCRPYLYGREFTNWIFNVKDPRSRLLRWRLKLEEYGYEVVYKRGSSITNADALSRIHIAETSPINTVETNPPTEQEKF